MGTAMDDVLMGLRAAAEPTRLRLLALCAEAELAVTELTQAVGQSQPRVSRHLKVLSDAGLVERHREGTWVFYRMTENGAQGRLARDILAHISGDEEALARDFNRLTAVKEARATAAAEYFRANVRRWDEIRALYVPEFEAETALFDIFGSGRIGDFLDIGTGTGRILEVFAPRIERGLGLDLSREMLAAARSRLDGAGLRNCRVRRGDMYDLALAAQSMDAVVIHQVLHFADRPARAIAEAARVLRPKGRVVIVDFAPHTLEFLRTEHAHRRLGFGDAEVARWYRAAGLAVGAPKRLVGDPLCLTLWPARKPVKRGAKARAP